MEKIILDEQNRNRIQKFIKQELGFYGYIRTNWRINRRIS